MADLKYDIEQYWNKVASFINTRTDNEVIAGDDEPYYEYKRQMFLNELDNVDFKNKKVLEFGCGPGGNIEYLTSKDCELIYGVDISQNMIDMAKKSLSNHKNVSIQKIDGIHLPFDNNQFDIVFTSTVLQHVTDDNMLAQIIAEMARVSNNVIILFERTEKNEKISLTNHGRTKETYIDLFSKHQFKITNLSYIKVHISYLFCGIARKCFDGRKQEGEKSSKINIALQRFLLFFTKKLDPYFNLKRDLKKLRFEKTNPL